MTNEVKRVYPPIDASKISIISILLKSGNISSALVSTENSDNSPLAFTTEVKAKNSVNMNNNHFITLLTISLEVIDDNTKTGTKGEFQLEIRFHVENLTEYLVREDIREEKKLTIIHNTLTGTIMGIAYSTARGIIFMRTLGSALEGIIIPVLDPLKIPGVATS